MSTPSKRNNQEWQQRWKQNRNNEGGEVTAEQRDFIHENALLLGFDKHAQWIGREKFLSQILPLRSHDEESAIRAFVQSMNIPRLTKMYKASERNGQARHSDTIPSAAIPTSPKLQGAVPSFGTQPAPRPPATKPPYQQYRPNSVPGPSAQDQPIPQVHALRQDRPKPTSDIPPPPALSDQACLLASAGTHKRDSEVEKAVMFSSTLLQQDPEAPRLLPQYGLLGIASDIRDPGGPQATDQRVFLNTNYPASFFICGLQGSGKSHTTSCILENHLLKSSILGHIEHPCSAMVFHYGHYTSRETFRPCEAAFLALRGQQFPDQPAVATVTVLVSPSNFHALSRSYSQIPGVNVRKLKLLAKDLHVSSLLTLMSCDSKASAPLYMGQVTKVLRDMAETATGGGFDYIGFKARLKGLDLTRDQRMPLDQRLDLLESFLDLENRDACFEFGPGSLTVVDLSCPFVDENTACVLFNICIGVYLGSEASDKGRIIAVDEAHKYMTDTPASKVLTDRLLSVIREQRHYGVRVIISTQEPTISPRLMDLSSATIIHRFTSPEWYNILRTHISVFQGGAEGMDLFEHIIGLDVGEALVFAPSAFVAYSDEVMPRKLNSELVKVAVRKRVTWDGGRSVLCV
ncbi:hypothetical protein K440DRAFT_609685 [Wilcoxina mikolae CBS 423.85]|nr:hypothetical protein K440DRAFT_609685 [Wilcoxina mikolae CBS 423.85]